MKQEQQELQFCDIEKQQLMQRANNCTIKIIGLVKSVFSSKKFVVQVMVDDKIVIRSLKTYDQFEATHQLIKIKYPNFQLGQYPSKFQLFNKNQTIKQYYQWLLNKVVENYNKKPTIQANKRLFTIIYVLLIRSIKEKHNSASSSTKSKQEEALKSALSQKSKIITSKDIIMNKQKNQQQDLTKSQGKNTIQKMKNFFKTQEKPRKALFDKAETLISKIKQKPVHKVSAQFSQKQPLVTQFQIQKSRTRRNSLGSIYDVQNQAILDITKQKENNKQKDKNNKSDISSSSFKKIEEISKVPKQLKFIPVPNNTSKGEYFFQVKQANDKQWKKRFLKVKDSSLLFFTHKMDRDFHIKIELFRIQVQYLHREKNFFDHFCQKMQINNEPTFKQFRDIITISHQYDFEKLQIRGLQFPQNFQKDDELTGQNLIQFHKSQGLKLQRLRNDLIKASQISPIADSSQGVFNPIGKVFLFIHRVSFSHIRSDRKDYLMVKVKTNNLEFQCKLIMLKQDNLIKQGFFIPISNTFQAIEIQVFARRQSGIIRQQSKDLSLGYYPLQFSDILTKPQGYKQQKKIVTLRKPLNSSPGQFMKQFGSVINLEISYENRSHYSSIYSESFSNQNDGKIISNLKLQDLDQLSITVDRLLRIIGTLFLFITCCWRNVYLFKYPILGKVFFSCLLVMFFLAQLKLFISIGVGFYIFIIIYNQPKINQFMNVVGDCLFFSKIHEDFKQPLCLGTSQIKYLKWSQAFQQIKREWTFSKDNKLEKIKEQQDQNKKKSYVEYIFKRHQKTFSIKQQQKSFLGKMFQGKKIIEVINRMILSIVNAIEKFANLFIWIDWKRTSLLLILLLVLSGVASALLLRLIGIVFCIHRLYKGKNFYSFKHYNRNRKIAVYTIRYILNNHFSSLLPSQQQCLVSEAISQRNGKKYLQICHQNQLEKIFESIQFPICDESSSKKLKNQIDKLISVYLDTDQLKESAVNNSKYTSISNDKQKMNQKSSNASSNFKTLQQNIKDKMMSSEAKAKQKQQKLSNSKTIKLSKIIDIIETCETRLQLQWVSGKQGLSNQFQQLKQLTKQTPLIDVWLQHGAKNFVLNMPSQLFVELKSRKQEKQYEFLELKKKQSLGEKLIKAKGSMDSNAVE